MSQQSKSKIFRLGFKTNDWKSKYIETNNEDRSLHLHQEMQIKEFLSAIFKTNDIFIYDFHISRSYNKINLIITYFPVVSNVVKDQPFRIQLENFLNSCTGNDIDDTKHRAELDTNCLERKFPITFVLKILRKFLGNSCKISLTFLNVKKSIFFKELFKKNLLQIIYQLRRYKKKIYFFQTLIVLLITYQKKNSAELLAKWISLQLSKMKMHNQFLSFLNVVLLLLLNSYFSNIKGIKILIKGRLNNKPRKRTKIIQSGKISLQTFDTVISQSQSVAFTKNGTIGIKVWICTS